MREFDCQDAINGLAGLGFSGRVSDNHDHHEHMKVLAKVMAVYVERNAKYRNTWEQYGALAQLVRAAQKVDRLMAMWWFEEYPGSDPEARPNRVPLTEEDLDDAEDAINHLIFFMRCARAGNLFGSKPDRPHPLQKKVLFDVGEDPGMPEVTRQLREEIPRTLYFWEPPSGGS